MTEIPIYNKALKVLTEQPDSFIIEDVNGEEKELFLYPLQLGRLAMISQRLISIDIIFDNNDSNNVEKMWRICAEKPKEVAEIIAIATLRTKQDIETHMKSRIEELLWSPTMTPQALYNVLYTIIFQSYSEDFMKAIRLGRMLKVIVSPLTGAKRIASMEDEAFGDK